MKESILKNIPIENIKIINRERKIYEVESLQSDIKEHSLIQPIAVEDLEDGTFRLLAGGRRITACRNLNYELMPCKVFPPLDEYERKCVEFAENIHREDITFAERASSTKKIHELWVTKYGEKKGPSAIGHSLQDTAKALGVSKMTVSREIELATAIEMVPSLAECKNQSEALKMFGKLKESMLREELAKRSDEILSKKGQDVLKRTLISSYIVGDFFENKMPSKSFHLIEIDPPFAIKLGKIKKLEDKSSLIDYVEIDEKDYPAFLDRIIKESYRLLLTNGWLIFWYAERFWRKEVEETLTRNGFEITGPHALWNKINTGSQCNWPDRALGSTYEPFFYARKGEAIIYKPGRSNVFTYQLVHPDKKIHPTEKPIELGMELLTCFCPPSGRVGVPCCGSGNTLLAASNLGMHPVGWDIAPTYKNYYTSRVIEGDYGQYRSYKEGS